MKKRTLSDDPSILEAVDNLSSMAELDIEELKVDTQTDQEEGLRVTTSRWLDPKSEERTLDSVKNTFKTVHKYLKHIYTKGHSELKDIDMQKGVQSILALATEAADKVDRCSSIFSHGKKRESIRESKEFKELEEFYQKKILKRFQEVLESEEAWKEEWEGEENVLDIERRGLKNLETVTRDHDYELFYITKEDGSKFYNKNLIRHIRLVADFDQIIGELQGEDPLVRVRVVLDKEAMLSAKTIFKMTQSQVNSWLKGAKHHRDAPLVSDLHKTLMALILSTNPRNLIGQTMGKSCLGYFEDFQKYLRELVEHVDYKAIIDNPPDDVDHFFHRMTTLIHTLSFHFFIHAIDQNDAFTFYHRIVEGHYKKDKDRTSHRNSLSFWNQILDDHEALYSELKQYPSGPLFKVLDILHDQDQELVFDPYLAQARSRALYDVHYLKNVATCMKLPAPLRQKEINKARILDEFRSALRHLADRKLEQKVLMINLQDRTSWQEFARCKALEDFRMNAEFKKYLYYVNLPKNTDFYLQSDLYIQNGDAKEFKQQLFEQVSSGSECGFCFPSNFKQEAINKFAKEIINKIHKEFFLGKGQLSRKNRLDFIEIFYFFFLLKVIDYEQPDYIAFTCKDGVDVSATASAGFYGFIKLLGKEQEWKEEEMDFFKTMLFTPALFLRERVVDIQRLSRTVSMLSVITGYAEMDQKKLVMNFKEFYSEKFLQSLSIKIAA